MNEGNEYFVFGEIPSTGKVDFLINRDFRGYLFRSRLRCQDRDDIFNRMQIFIYSIVGTSILLLISENDFIFDDKNIQILMYKNKY